MNITKRIYDLLQILCSDFLERESCLKLGFLAAINNEPFFLYGRTGSGKRRLIRKLSAAFKDAKILQMGYRQQVFPNKLDKFDIIIFEDFDPADEAAKENIRTTLQNITQSAFVISSDIRPENAMGRAAIADKITLTVSLPDSISAKALCSLLQNQSKLPIINIPEDLTITPEEKSEWIENIKNVKLSSDTLAVVGQIADLCIQNDIYIPISKWIALTNISKSIAFFNSRAQTVLSDTLFLGGNIWGRSTSNKIISEKFNAIIKSVMLKDLANVVENAFDANALYSKIYTLMHSSNNLYETKDFNGEPCVSYRITVAGESTPLYVPLRYVETNENFNPYNEFRQIEKHVRCNFHSTSSCTISIDVAIKSIGLRNNIQRSSTTEPEKFEDFATMPTYILRENDAQVAQEKRNQLEECKKEALEQMDTQAKILRTLRDLYQSNRVYRNDLFCNIELFDKIQDEIREMFDTINSIANKLKEALNLFNKVN